MRASGADRSRVIAARWIVWLVVALCWTFDGIVSTLGSYALGRPFGHELAITLVASLLWVPYTIAALELSHRFPVERGRLARGLAVHAAAAAVVVVTRPAVYFATDPWLHWSTSPADFAKLLVGSIRYNIFLYALIAGATHAVYFALRARQRERHAARLATQLADARLETLRSQLRPHFLFNALGGIAELVHHDPAGADRMLVRLAQLLRIALDESGVHVVPLAHELCCLEPYVELEKMRYGDRLTVIEEVDPDVRDAYVPILLLQPLVENAIRHGIAPRPTPGTVTIRARRAGRGVELEVEDDGVGIPPGVALGIGLGNTRARLTELYGPTSTLAFERGRTGGTRVRVSLPDALPEAAR